MLRRVGVLGVDGTQSFTVIPIGEPFGTIVRIFIGDGVTGASYEVYPVGEQAYCTPGFNLSVSVHVRNDGDVDGNIFGRIIDADTGEVLDERARSVSVGDETMLTTIITMPSYNLNLIIEVGH